MNAAQIAFVVVLAAALVLHALARSDRYDPRDDDEAHQERPLWGWL